MQQTRTTTTPNGNIRNDIFFHNIYLGTFILNEPKIFPSSTQEEIDAFHESEGYILVDGQWTFPQPELDENGLQITS